MADIGKVLALTATIFLLLTLTYNLKLVKRLPYFPWDVWINKPGYDIYLPWLSSIILSVIITLFMNFFRK